MASQNVMEEVSVEQLINKHSLIVPEIQREYVWGNNEFEILDKFFKDIKESIGKKTNSSSNSDELKTLERMLELADESGKDYIKSLLNKAQSAKNLNMGFLYSYRPPYYIANDRSEDVYLIDGQQRFTTLFLSLFYFSLKENKYSDFKELFKFNAKSEKLAFDYRVRSLTHNFLIELLTNCNSIDDIRNISKKTWYLSDFAGDVTINAMVGVEKHSNKKEIIGAFKKLDEYFANDEVEYYDFIKKQVKFWHFKTEETSQGEELYITMNSRGQQLADNENLRAKLFENEEVKGNQIYWGKEWEEWQDFFWKNKEKSGNADLGFNQFLKWVSIIECLKNESFKSNTERERRYKEIQKNNEISEDIKLPTIKSYFESLKILRIKFDEGHFKPSWFKENFDPEWIKKTIDQKHLIKLLPALIYLSFNKPQAGLNRFIRFFSNLTKGNVIARNPDTYIVQSILLSFEFCITDSVDIVDIVAYKSQFSQLITDEEEYKLGLFRNATIDRETIENCFWTAEDYSYCNGKIDYLLELSFFQGEPQKFSYQNKFAWSLNGDFNLSLFSSIFHSYREITTNIGELWGDFLCTDIYMEYGNRITYKYWPRNVDLLKLVLERVNRVSEKLLDFIILNEKAFIKQYNGDSTKIKNETSSKRQLYLYYILHKRILNQWNWKGKFNFGTYDLYSDNLYLNCQSIFANNNIYQFYATQWRFNVGYEANNGIWIQDNKLNRDHIADLVAWANK